jgi:hypothetical protein
MKFDNASSQKSGRSIAIEFRMINVHTGWYVIARGAAYTARVKSLLTLR